MNLESSCCNRGNCTHSKVFFAEFSRGSLSISNFHVSKLLSKIGYLGETPIYLTHSHRQNSDFLKLISMKTGYKILPVLKHSPGCLLSMMRSPFLLTGALTLITASSIPMWSAVSTATTPVLPEPSQDTATLAKKQCVEDGTYEPAASNTRTVQIPDFGIEVDIPENYRTMRRQDGAIEILHPDDYEFIHCMMSGGEGLGHGYYSEFIEVIESGQVEDELRELQASYEASNLETREYRQGNFSGYMLSSGSRRRFGRAMFIGRLDGNDRLFRITPSCDCDTEESEVVALLSKIRLMR